MDLYVVDTSALLRDPDLLEKMGGTEVILHAAVLEELDQHRHGRHQTLAATARRVMNFLYELRGRGSLARGISYRQGLIRLDDRQPDMTRLGFGLDPGKVDNLLLALTLALRLETDQRVVLVTADKALAVKARWKSIETLTVSVPTRRKRPLPNKGYFNKGAQLAQSRA